MFSDAYVLKYYWLCLRLVGCTYVEVKSNKTCMSRNILGLWHVLWFIYIHLYSLIYKLCNHTNFAACKWNLEYVVTFVRLKRWIGYKSTIMMYQMWTTLCCRCWCTMKYILLWDEQPSPCGSREWVPRCSIWWTIPKMQCNFDDLNFHVIQFRV